MLLDFVIQKVCSHCSLNTFTEWTLKHSIPGNGLRCDETETVWVTADLSPLLSLMVENNFIRLEKL